MCYLLGECMLKNVLDVICSGLLVNELGQLQIV
jgi:hypothetical protein